MPTFPPITHLAVTVTDLDRSTKWYTRLFGSAPVLDEDEATGGFHHTVFALGEGRLFGLHAHTGHDPGPGFNQRHTGLDHVAFSCESRAELEQWRAKLDQLAIDHGDIVDAHYGSGLSFRDPDGIALEFFAPPE